MDLTIDQVYTFKLNSGEELVTKLKEISADYLLIEEPVSIAPSHQGMGLVPSMFTATPRQNVRLNTKSISLIALTDDAVKMKYLEATTGIKVPEKKLILG